MPLPLELLGLENKDKINIFELTEYNKPIEQETLLEMDEDTKELIILEVTRGIDEMSTHDFGRFVEKFMYIQQLNFDEETKQGLRSKIRLRIEKDKTGVEVSQAYFSLIFDGNEHPHYDNMNSIRSDRRLFRYFPLLYALKTDFPEIYETYSEMMEKEKLGKYCKFWQENETPADIDDKLPTMAFIKLMFPDRTKEYGLNFDAPIASYFLSAVRNFLQVTRDNLATFADDEVNIQMLTHSFIETAFSCHVLFPDLEISLSEGDIKRLVKYLEDLKQERKWDEYVESKYMLRVIMDGKVKNNQDDDRKLQIPPLPRVRRF